MKAALARTPVVGGPVYTALHGLKRGIKDFLQPQVLFEDLGLKYVGPIDGHDTALMESALRRAKAFGGPVIVHAVTVKGYGYQPAVDDEADCLHSVAPVTDPVTGKPVNASARGWTGVLAEEMVAIGAERPDVVAITAAMLQPVGLLAFSQAYPDRTFDVGIAEQHAVTSAAGLAMGGMHPVVCLYATFMNRAFDQALMDVALHRLPVTFVLDRAGVTGEDGASHNGMWDLSLLQLLPGIRLAAPRDGATLREELREALAVDDGPTAVRFPKGAVGEDLPALERLGVVDVLRRSPGDDVLLVAEVRHLLPGEIRVLIIRGAGPDDELLGRAAIRELIIVRLGLAPHVERLAQRFGCDRHDPREGRPERSHLQPDVHRRDDVAVPHAHGGDPVATDRGLHLRVAEPVDVPEHPSGRRGDDLLVRRVSPQRLIRGAHGCALVTVREAPSPSRTDGLPVATVRDAQSTDAPM